MSIWIVDKFNNNNRSETSNAVFCGGNHEINHSHERLETLEVLGTVLSELPIRNDVVFLTVVRFNKTHRQKRMKKILVIIIVFPLFLIAQGPIDGYLKGEGNLDMAAGMNFSRSRDYYGTNNQVYQLPYSADMFSVFAQYGIKEKLDAVVTIPFIFGQFENKFQDMGLFLKYRPIYKEFNKKGKFGTLLSAGYTFPMSDYTPDATGALGQRAQIFPLRLVSQVEFYSGFFFNVTGTYNVRVDKLSEETITSMNALNPNFVLADPENSAVFLMRAGVATTHHFFEAILEYQKTFGGVDFVPGVVQPSQLYGVDYLKVGATYYYGFETNGIALNTSFIPRGRNIGNILSISLSFIIKFKDLNKKGS